MSQQLTFDLPHRSAMGREDFFVSEGNQNAVAAIEAWADWPLGKLLLVGAEGAGKSHLVQVWAALTGAEVIAAEALSGAVDRRMQAAGAGALAIEDADRIAGDRACEEALFHLHNAQAQAVAPLLLTARRPPSQWGIGLPDLASRMAQTGLQQLAPPDDALLLAVMAKLAHDRGLGVSASALSFAASRIERSFAAAAAFVAALDQAALREQRSPSRALARSVLSELDGA